MKLAAEASFARVQHAYEGACACACTKVNRPLLTKLFETVLSDQHKRAVYDLLGEDGLNGDWQVGQKLKSASEVSFDRWFSRMWRLTACDSYVRNTSRSS